MVDAPVATLEDEVDPPIEGRLVLDPLCHGVLCKFDGITILDVDERQPHGVTTTEFDLYLHTLRRLGRLGLRSIRGSTCFVLPHCVGAELVSNDCIDDHEFASFGVTLGPEVLCNLVS